MATFGPCGQIFHVECMKMNRNVNRATETLCCPMCRGLPQYIAETPDELYQRTGRIYSDEEEDAFLVAVEEEEDAFRVAFREVITW